jgi:hypothetical protein
LGILAISTPIIAPTGTSTLMNFQIRSHMIIRLLLTTALLTLASAVSSAAPAPGNPMALPSDAELSGAGSTKLDPPSAQAPDAQQFAQRVQEMSRRYAPIDFDPELRAKSLGNGIEPTFKYVRDEIRFESYPGVFRGAKGAYLSRAANAADRSLLLSQMLGSQPASFRRSSVKFSLAECLSQAATPRFQLACLPQATSPSACGHAHCATMP